LRGIRERGGGGGSISIKDRRVGVRTQFTIDCVLAQFTIDCTRRALKMKHSAVRTSYTTSSRPLLMTQITIDLCSSCSRTLKKELQTDAIHDVDCADCALAVKGKRAASVTTD